MELLRKLVCANLPQQIIEVQPPGPAFPSSAPCGQIIVHRPNSERALSNLCIDGRLIICAAQNCYVMPLLDESEHPVPTNRGLRSFIGFTGVCRQKNLHIQEIYT